MISMPGVADTKRRFAEILDRVSEGERVIVSRRGRPVAAIVPVPAAEEDSPLGLAAFAGALAGRGDDLDEVVGGIVATRSVCREREVPEVE
jgi:prevent-host-death family protein